MTDPNAIRIPCRRSVKVTFNNNGDGTSAHHGANPANGSGGKARVGGMNRPQVHPSISTDSLSTLSSSSSFSSLLSVLPPAPPSTTITKPIPHEPAESSPVLTPVNSSAQLSTAATAAADTATAPQPPLPPITRPPPWKQLKDIQMLFKQPIPTTTMAASASASVAFPMFVVSAAWFRRWCRHVHSAAATNNGSLSAPNSPMRNAAKKRTATFDPATTASEEAEEPGPIDNAALLLLTAAADDDAAADATTVDPADAAVELKPRLQFAEDYIVVPEVLWAALHGWYRGGPPIRRLVHAAAWTTHPAAVHSVYQLPPLRHPAVLHALFPREEDRSFVLQNLRSAAGGGTGAGDGGSDGDIVSGVGDGSGSVDDAAALCDVRLADDLYPPATRRSSSATTATATEEVQTTTAATLATPATPATPPQQSSSVSQPPVSQPQPQRQPTCVICGAASCLICSRCKGVYYCSKNCQRTHWRQHKHVCRDVSSSETHGDTTAATHRSVGTHRDTSALSLSHRVGLVNLGNTCYLSSTLQCLAAIAPLTSFFVSQRYQDEVNVRNRDGTGGQLAHAYARLLSDLKLAILDTASRTTTGGSGGGVSQSVATQLLRTAAAAATRHHHPTFRPVAFKHLLGSLRDEYRGFQQHDAHELIEFLLDKLHEDVNRVTVCPKPYTEKVEGDGANDYAIAREAWRRGQLRDASMIRDTLGYLMRNELQCDTCGRRVVSYEYHQTMEVAIPPPPKAQPKTQPKAPAPASATQSRHKSTTTTPPPPLAMTPTLLAQIPATDVTLQVLVFPTALTTDFTSATQPAKRPPWRMHTLALTVPSHRPLRALRDELWRQLRDATAAEDADDADAAALVAVQDTCQLVFCQEDDTRDTRDADGDTDGDVTWLDDDDDATAAVGGDGGRRRLPLRATPRHLTMLADTAPVYTVSPASPLCVYVLRDTATPSAAATTAATATANEEDDPDRDSVWVFVHLRLAHLLTAAETRDTFGDGDTGHDGDDDDEESRFSGFFCGYPLLFRVRRATTMKTATLAWQLLLQAACLWLAPTSSYVQRVVEQLYRGLQVRDVTRRVAEDVVLRVIDGRRGTGLLLRDTAGRDTSGGGDGDTSWWPLGSRVALDMHTSVAAALELSHATQGRDGVAGGVAVVRHLSCDLPVRATLHRHLLRRATGGHGHSHSHSHETPLPERLRLNVPWREALAYDTFATQHRLVTATAATATTTEQPFRAYQRLLRSQPSPTATPSPSAPAAPQPKPPATATAPRHVSLDDCLREFCRVERLDDGNEWYCSACQAFRPATKIVSFCREFLPQVLIVTLKRFEFHAAGSGSGSGSGGFDAAAFGAASGVSPSTLRLLQQQFAQRQKIDTFVDFPIDGLNIAPFCGGSGRTTSSATDDDPTATAAASAEEEEERVDYDLFAVCHHYGRCGFGHYTATVRDWDPCATQDTAASGSDGDRNGGKGGALSDTWYHCDDDKVTRVGDAAKIRSSSAYVLFYRRR